MSSIIIEGGTPLMGDITISGSLTSSLRLVYASMFSNEDIILENVPKVQGIEDSLEIIRSVGGDAQWAGPALILNGSKLNSYEIPYEIGSKQRTSILLAGPLLYRFGKAKIPKYKSSGDTGSLDKLVDIWKCLGIGVSEDKEYYSLDGEDMASNSIVFKTPTHMGTDNAILFSIFVEGETLISNVSEESEIDDLIDLINLMGGNVLRTEPKEIKIIGSNIFKDAKFTVCPSKIEVVALTVAAAVTNGDILIKGIRKEPLIPLVNFLNKVGVKYEISDREVKVWRNNEELNPTHLKVCPTPGFISDWQSLATLLLTQSNGVSTVYDATNTSRFDYVIDLNRMGAKINVVSPLEIDLVSQTGGDPNSTEEGDSLLNVAKIEGPTKLRGEKLHIDSNELGLVLVVAALCSEGKSEIIGIENIEDYFENFVDKFKALGAKVWEP